MCTSTYANQARVRGGVGRVVCKEEKESRWGLGWGETKWWGVGAASSWIKVGFGARMEKIRQGEGSECGTGSEV